MKDMHPVGKRIMMIPIVILVFAILLRFTGLLSPDKPQGNAVRPSQIRDFRAIPTATGAPDNSYESIFSPQKINLRGPLRCDYLNEGTAVTVRVHNKNILIKYVAKESAPKLALVNDGALYIWEQGTYEGQRIEGVGEYLNMVETFSSFLTPSMLLSFIPQLSESGISKDDIESVSQSCEEGEIDDSVFTVPQAIKFIDVDIKDLKIPE